MGAPAVVILAENEKKKFEAMMTPDILAHINKKFPVTEDGQYFNWIKDDKLEAKEIAAVLLQYNYTTAEITALDEPGREKQIIDLMRNVVMRKLEPFVFTQ